MTHPSARLAPRASTAPTACAVLEAVLRGRRSHPQLRRSQPAHFKQYAHPARSNRPVCPYGVYCTRENPVHFMEELHADEMEDQ